MPPCVRQPTRRAVTLVDDARERTITTFGPRLEPLGDDAALPWDELSEMDAVYFTAGDLDALRAARAARVLVANPRALDALGHGVPLDALVLSEKDDDRAASRRARRGRGRAGRADRRCARRLLSARAPARLGAGSAVPSPGEPVDSYGCGDSFAAGLTYGLGAGHERARRARARRPLRRRLPDRPWAVRAPAEHRPTEQRCQLSNRSDRRQLLHEREHRREQVAALAITRSSTCGGLEAQAPPGRRRRAPRAPRPIRSGVETVGRSAARSE